MPRFRPRISILNALLLTTIVAMAITIVQLWREVGPLRKEVRGQRAELGYLTVDDPANAYAISVDSPGEKKWKWRLYLPAGRQHFLHCYTGNLPSSPYFDRAFNKKCFDAAKRAGTTNSGTIDSGEFTLEAILTRESGRWVFRIPSIGSMSDPQWSGDWLTKARSWQLSSDVGAKGQIEFKPGEPILSLAHYSAD